MLAISRLERLAKSVIDRAESVSEEGVAFLLQPDVLIPAQCFEALRAKNGLEPEERLMLAVLEDAVRCFQDNVSARERSQEKTFCRDGGMVSGTGRGVGFSFENICQALGLIPECVRRGLLRWKKKISGPLRPAWEPITLAG
jgi:hypothetical protein